MTKFTDLDTAVVALRDAMIKDYARYNTVTSGNYNLPQSYYDERLKEYAENFRIEEGRTYIKLIGNGSVKGFIVKKPTKGFKVGDMLMAASYKAPATNFSRGNVFDGQFDRIRWTGIQ